MKVKEKEKKRQMEEQAEVTESPVKSIATSSSMTIKTKQGHMITIECVADIAKGEELRTKKKVDDKLGDMQVVQAEVHRNPEPSDKVNVEMEESEKESESTHQEPMKINRWLNLKIRVMNLLKPTNLTRIS